MPTGQQYATNVPQTTLTSGITSTATTFSVASSANWPNTPFTAVLDLGQSNQEPIDVTLVSGVNWTVTRAIDNTAAFAHASNATVTHADIGRDFREARSHIDTGTAVHGLAGAVVGTTDAQTLGSKTLTSPTITGTVAGGASYTAPTITGTVPGGATYTTPTLDRPVITGTTPSAPPAGDLALYVNSGAPSVFTPGGNTGSLIQPAADATLNNMKAWTTNPDAVVNNNLTISGTSGQSIWVRFNIYAPTSVSNMWIDIGTVGSGLTANQNFGGIYNSAGTKIAQTADQSANWTSSGTKQMALTGGPFNLDPGTYYAVLLFNGTTSPGISQVSYGSGGPKMNIGIASAPGRSNILTSGLTSLPATQNLASLGLILNQLAFIGIS